MINIFNPTSDNKCRYFMNEIVILIKEYRMFKLSKVRYLDDRENFIVESQLLTKEPTIEHTISIHLLGGSNYDT